MKKLESIKKTNFEKLEYKALASIKGGEEGIPTSAGFDCELEISWTSDVKWCASGCMTYYGVRDIDCTV